MKWNKLGLVYKPTGLGDWAIHTATLPTPILLSPEIIRVYVSFCDANGVGRPGYVDVDATNPTRVLKVSSNPLLDIGPPGTFDDNGAVVCSVVDAGDGVYYMYYVGFEQCMKVRYRLFTGLAISDDGGQSFRKYKTTPILERSPEELYFRCGPFVMRDGGLFRMWYIAGSEWTEVDGKSVPVYALRYLESPDGLHWGDCGEQQMEITGADEHGFGRPWVDKRPNGTYELFYSIRRRTLGAYRLGYARSTDGATWVRDDASLGLDVTPGSFDSDAIEYSAVIEAGGKTYCFYNGNAFGRDGFAVAELAHR
ncbi:hypothetical protein R69746_07272 [Paraburkholderia aspalathi]|uniref:hypothetical protein n=1 Tax=Paraburkholderia aspalathi TaxID=1324617 RepID=UPI00190B32CD|nr:hypothetical protein [Paraburkholderia aspalathi]MBK3843263.1 hypothetical protein [Paraburkholderia aspalathi]CAE6849212.1 hypothetical protein R69746_07272 [Paraburkholderia aspalathi]